MNALALRRFWLKNRHGVIVGLAAILIGLAFFWLGALAAVLLCMSHAHA